MSHYEKLKALKMGLASDFYTALYARSMSGGSKEYERFISGELPLILSDSVGKPLVSWSITGNTVQDGEPTPEQPIEVKGTGDKTGNLLDTKNAVYGKRMAQNVIDVTDTGFILHKIQSGTQERPYTSIKADKTGTYTISCTTKQTSGGTTVFLNYGLYVSDEKPTTAPNTSERTVTVVQGQYITFVLTTVSAATGDLEVSNIMLNSGSKPLPYEPYGYKVPVVSKVDGQEITTPIYLNSPLMADEVLRSNGTVSRADGTTETVSIPQIPTFAGNCIIDVDTEVKAKNMTIDYLSSEKSPDGVPLRTGDGEILYTADNEPLTTER